MSPSNPHLTKQPRDLSNANQPVSVLCLKHVKAACFFLTPQLSQSVITFMICFPIYWLSPSSRRRTQRPETLSDSTPPSPMCSRPDIQWTVHLVLLNTLTHGRWEVLSPDFRLRKVSHCQQNLWPLVTTRYALNRHGSWQEPGHWMNRISAEPFIALGN